MSSEFTREEVMKFLPAQFSWFWWKCLQSNFIHSKRFQSDRIQVRFTAHYTCGNADLNMILLAVRTNGFFFKIIDPLIQLTWLDLGLPQIDLTSFWESGESCLGRKNAERATKSRRRSRERTSRLDCKGSFHYAKIFGNFGREKRQDSSVRVEISGQSGPKIIVSSLTLVSST